MEQNPTPNLTPSEPQAPAPAPTPEPASAPAEPAGSVVEPAPKKKKGGLIAAIIIAILVIGGAVAAVLLLSGGGDVKSATSKFFDTLTAITSTEESNVENKNLKIDGGIDIKVKSGSTDASVGLELDLEANDKSDMLLSLGLKGVSMPGITLGGGIGVEARSFVGKSAYIKLSGIENILSSYLGSMLPSSLEDIDNTWIKINADDLMGENLSGLSVGSAECLEKELNKDTISKLFSEDELSKVFTLEKYNGDKKAESGTTYKLKVDEDAAKKFGEKLQSEYNNILKTCGVTTEEEKNIDDGSRECPEGWIARYGTCVHDNDSSGGSEIGSVLEKIEQPDVFVVIDKGEISRIFTNIDIEGGTTISIDLNLSYPKTLDIEEPKDATPIEDIMDDLGGLLGGGGGSTTCKSGYTYDYTKKKCIEDEDDYSCPTGYYYNYYAGECVRNVSTDPEIEALVDEFYDSLLDEEPEIADLVSEDDLKPIIEDLVICLDDAGVQLDSLDDLDESDESVVDCYSVFQSDIEDLFSDYLDF